MLKRFCAVSFAAVAGSSFALTPAQAQPLPARTASVIPCAGGFESVAGRRTPVTLPALRVNATAIDSFSIRISWTGRIGAKYTVRELGGSYSVSGVVAPIDVTVTRPGEPRSGGPTTATGAPATPGSNTRQVFATHERALPGSAHSYEIKEELADGTNVVCGTAGATTPPPPALSASGNYIDTRHLAITFQQPTLAFTTRLSRPRHPIVESAGPPVSIVNDIGRPDHYDPSVTVTGPSISLTVDPGPPPFPYTGGKYDTNPTYPFTLEAVWTENPDGSGKTFTLKQPFEVKGPAPIIGYADLHSHQFSYYGFGGNPRDYPSGKWFFGRAFDQGGDISKALPWCTPEHGPGGAGDLANWMMNWFTDHSFPIGHAVGGYPAFDGWPRWNSFTHQAYYEDWLKRAHDAGLKLIVVHPVNNEWMCTTLNNVSAGDLASIAAGGLSAPLLAAKIAYSQTHIDEQCKDKYAAPDQVNEAFAMQAAIDARSGGPGKGWYRIVRSPVEARSVIANGQLAVVIGMEVDNPFECTVDNPDCASPTGSLPPYVEAQLNTYYEMGVRHFFPIHFYDNAFGGSANSNFLITSAFRNPMTKRTCEAEGYQYDFTPATPEQPQCNATGLTNSGKAFVQALMNKGMVIDVDHLSAKSFNDVMAIVGPQKYPVISGHAGFTEIAHRDENNEGNRTPAQVQQIVDVGGMFAIIPHQGDRYDPSAMAIDANGHEFHIGNGIGQFPAGSNIPHNCGNSSETVAQAYRYAIAKNGGAPVGIGTDLNGFAGWPSPRFGSYACSGGQAPGYDPNSSARRLSYPFTIKATGVNITLDRSVVGAKTFDFNVDGFAHIGMLPDMIADFEAMGMAPEELDPLFLSAEGYIRVWERASYMAVSH